MLALSLRVAVGRRRDLICALLRSIALQIQFTGEEGDARPGGEGEHMVRSLQATREGVDEKLQRSRIQLFQVRLAAAHLSEGQRRRFCRDFTDVRAAVGSLPSVCFVGYDAAISPQYDLLCCGPSPLQHTQGGAELRGDLEMEATEAPDSASDEDNDDSADDDTSKPPWPLPSLAPCPSAFVQRLGCD